MGKLDLTYATVKDQDGTAWSTLAKEDFARFNTDILDLGVISQESKYFEALAAMFDLEGFTLFCNQVDPHLAVPEYLELFFSWLFSELGAEFTSSDSDDRKYLWARLPFFAKFMGDGILFLWDTKFSTESSEIGNIVISLQNICDRYETVLLPSVRRHFTRPPARLRCGIARGQVISIGNGADYVGSCINMAARLQKLGKLRFAFPRRGFNLEKCFAPQRAADFIARRVAIRGIGDSEIVIVIRAEFEALDPEDRALFLDP